MDTRHAFLDEAALDEVPIFADIDDAFSKSLLLESCSSTDVLSALERLIIIRMHNTCLNTEVHTSWQLAEVVLEREFDSRGSSPTLQVCRHFEDGIISLCLAIWRPQSGQIGHKQGSGQPICPQQ